jgi:ribbon-helix-helix CopG family protein
MAKKKLTVELNERATARLDNLAKSKGLSKVDILRRALALYEYVEEQAEAGNRFAITDSTGQPIELFFRDLRVLVSSTLSLPGGERWTGRSRSASENWQESDTRRIQFAL